MTRLRTKIQGGLFQIFRILRIHTIIYNRRIYKGNKKPRNRDRLTHLHFEFSTRRKGRSEKSQHRHCKTTTGEELEGGRGASPVLLVGLRGRGVGDLRVRGQVRGAGGRHLGRLQDLRAVVGQPDVSGLMGGVSLPRRSAVPLVRGSGVPLLSGSGVPLLTVSGSAPLLGGRRRGRGALGGV